MSRLNSKSPTNKTQHILHPLNLSKTKTVFSFEKAKRFTDPQSYSPNKFYNLPSTLNRISCSIGIGSRHKAEKPYFIQPTKYNIVSEFDLKGHKRTSSASFGIGREVNYLPRRSTTKDIQPKIYQDQEPMTSPEISAVKKFISDKNSDPSKTKIRSLTNSTSQEKPSENLALTRTKMEPIE